MQWESRCCPPKPGVDCSKHRPGSSPSVCLCPFPLPRTLPLHHRPGSSPPPPSSSPPQPCSPCPVSTRVAESVEAEAAVAVVPGEVEELKVAVGLRGEGQVELHVAVLVYSSLGALVPPVHPEPVGKGTTARAPAPSWTGRGETLASHPQPQLLSEFWQWEGNSRQWRCTASPAGTARRGIFTQTASRL